MRFEWIIIESFTILIENFAYLYFLNSRFISKNTSRLPQIIAWIALSMVGHAVAFSGIIHWVYDGAGAVLMFLFILVSKHGTIQSKILGVAVTFALIIGTTLLGATIVSALTDVDIGHIQLYQDTPRLFAIIFIKAMQVSLFYLLAKRDADGFGSKKTVALIFLFLIAIVFACMYVIFTGTDGLDAEHNNLLIWLSAGLLTILVIIFIGYELLVRSESKNNTLLASLQRMEVERHYINEIDSVYADIRKWRHEYKTNLTAIRALVESGAYREALSFLEKLDADITQYDNLLQTGNVILDAVVSSKLAYARAKDIDINVHAIYPQDSELEGMDLCAIVGNVLDNAIEACQKMSDGLRKKFISFSLLAIGENMAITISNSYEGTIKIQGGHYISSKGSRFGGIGIRYVDSIIDKYHGHIIREHNSGIFNTYIVLPLKPPPKEIMKP